MKFQITIALLILALCGCSSEPSEEAGVSLSLAENRAKSLDSISYALRLAIPEMKTAPIAGRVHINVYLKKPKKGLVLDFQQGPEAVHGVIVNDDTVDYRVENGHLLIGRKALTDGHNAIDIHFTAGAQSLNRNDDYLYSLFVPDRASTAFPCFDQPDLKARFSLTLEIPERWKGLSNAPLTSSSTEGGSTILEFERTQPISTYLLAFAAGDFKEEIYHGQTRTMRMLYRETDSVLVQKNVPDIFKMHRDALQWMETYTQVPYPFEKFDFALIPTFQYGGMEHPGSIFYRESSLILGETTTMEDKMNRARLIAHETAHMWFGDLVTMKWFNDVWVKEVFASFMADKIVNPLFPWINHELNFLLNHHPPAYRVDRTAGANAIRQPLANLKDAGMLYGNIIYHKAPIMMQHLEQLMGKQPFQSGLQQYLSSYAFKNADWSDLIAILDGHTEVDIAGWSKQWIETPGMPEYTYSRNGNSVTIQQSNPYSSQMWRQQLHPMVVKGAASPDMHAVFVDTQQKDLDISAGDILLLNGHGTEYGGFILDEQSVNGFANTIHTIQDRYIRSKAWLDMYETFLHGKIPPHRYLNILQKGLLTETDQQLSQELLSQLETIYWHFLTPASRQLVATNLEKVLRDMLLLASAPETKYMYFQSFMQVAHSQESLAYLHAVWADEEAIPSLTFNESDDMAIALELALKRYPGSEDVLQQQLDRIENPDRKARFEFLLPAVSWNQNERDAFFASLKDSKNREQEPWVIKALYLLHHPLQADASIGYLLPSLEMLPEIQQTGDIFFPKRWLDATFSGHQSSEAIKIVEQFLSDHPEFPSQLRMKVLQSTDQLHRINGIVQEQQTL